MGKRKKAKRRVRSGKKTVRKKASVKSCKSPKKAVRKPRKKAPKRVARATRKVSKVARVLGQRARKARPARVEVSVVSRGLGEAPERYHFVLSDGRRLRSLYELVDEFETMSDDMFRHHVNEFRNDFAAWMGDVFDEKHLADEIRWMQNRMDVQRAILKHLVRELRKESRRRK